MSELQCKHCLKRFVREGSFKKHSCKQMEKHKILHSPLGMIAYDDYSAWLSYKGYRAATRESFLDSNHFTSFIKFATFADNMALPSKTKFMKHMAELDIYPKDWASKEVYEHYIKQFETILTPEEQAAITVETIFELAKIFECNPNEIFSHLESSNLIKIVQAKKMSPWILLFSVKFLRFVKGEMTREQRVLLARIIDYEKWGVIFNEHPDIVEHMKVYVKALEI